MNNDENLGREEGEIFFLSPFLMVIWDLRWKVN